MLSIILLKNNPTNPAGIIPIIKYLINFQLFLSSFNNWIISFRVKIITANKDARCRNVIKNKLGDSRRLDKIARCPLEEIGRNSVIA